MRLTGMCVSFFLLFFSFYGTQEFVVPTLGNFGSEAVGVQYAFLAASAVAAPTSLRVLRRLSRGRGQHHPQAIRASLRAETLALSCCSSLYVPFTLASTSKSMHAAQLISSAFLGAGAGLLWVSQGSLLTASTNHANRGRWTGAFWASFMAGNAAGNLGASALVTATSSTSTMFFGLAAVGALSTMSFAIVVRPRPSSQLPPSQLPPLQLPPSQDSVERITVERRAAEAERRSSAAAAATPSACHENVTQASQASVLAPSVIGADDAADAGEPSLSRDVCALARLLVTRQTAALLPLMLFTGAQAAFWGGEYPSIISRLGASHSIGFVICSLALSDMLFSVLCGVAVDRGHAKLALLAGLTASCTGLALIQLRILPLLPSNSTLPSLSGGGGGGGGGGHAGGTVHGYRIDDGIGEAIHSTGGVQNGTDDASAVALVFTAAILLGCGDAAVNTFTISRLGSLSEDVALLEARAPSRRQSVRRSGDEVEHGPLEHCPSTEPTTRGQAPLLANEVGGRSSGGGAMRAGGTADDDDAAPPLKLQREAAFQLVQMANNCASAAAFVYAPYLPLVPGEVPYQVLILSVLAVAGAFGAVCL